MRALEMRASMAFVMPEVSRFFGIVITMYYNDHEPPHFHARYGEHKAIVAIETFDVLDGTLPSRALGLVLEWASAHRDELIMDWQRARALQPLERIAPLE
jgi:hypothetical protein